MMHQGLPCVADNSSQFAYEHIKQLDCAPYLAPSSEVSPYKPVSGKYQVSDEGMDGLLSNPEGDARLGHEASCLFSAVVNKAVEMNTSNISSAVVLNSNEIAELENAKRPSSSHSLDEAVYKRARHLDQSRKVEQFLELPAFSIIFGQNHLPHIHGEEDMHSPFSEYLCWKRVPIGPGHQADVPEFRSYSKSVYLDFDEKSTNKWLGTCIMPMPDLVSISVEVQSYKSTFDCYCRDAGSIRCVRSHIMGSRENLERKLGHEKFMKLGLCDMGETVAQRWTIDEENLFREIVLSNPQSLGRNFWHLLSLSFPTRSSKELISYYFNVFILQNRADQNRSDPLNADSDNDEWRECSEEEDSAVESPIDRDDTDQERDLFEQDETDTEEYELCHVGCEDGLHGGSDECRVYESKSDKNLSYHADGDVQDDSCTSSEVQFNEGKHDHENLHVEYKNDSASAVTDYDCIDGHYIGGTGKVVEFLPTCYVIEEMIGKES